MVKSGRFNKKNRELYDIEINEEEAEVVKTLFRKRECKIICASDLSNYKIKRKGRAKNYDQEKREKQPLFPREVMREFIKQNNIVTAEDAQKAVKELFANTLQELLEGELDYTLGYEKNDTENKDTSNRRNGHTDKTVRSDYGEIDLEIPRDREGEFDPVIVKKHQKNITGIEDQILALYAKGVSTREIQDHLEQLYGIDKF